MLDRILNLEIALLYTSISLRNPIRIAYHSLFRNYIEVMIPFYLVFYYKV